LHQIVAEIVPGATPMALGRVADVGRDRRLLFSTRQRWPRPIMQQHFPVHLSHLRLDDILGVEIGGASKCAATCGISDGRAWRQCEAT
jgi:hypothetical protein